MEVAYLLLLLVEAPAYAAFLGCYFGPSSSQRYAPMSKEGADDEKPLPTTLSSTPLPSPPSPPSPLPSLPQSLEESPLHHLEAASSLRNTALMETDLTLVEVCPAKRESSKKQAPGGLSSRPVGFWATALDISNVASVFGAPGGSGRFFAWTIPADVDERHQGPSEIELAIGLASSRPERGTQAAADLSRRRMAVSL